MLNVTVSAAAIAAALLAGSTAVAQTAPPAPADASAAGVGPAAEQPAQGTQTGSATGSADGDVIVTGTRTTGLRASDSPAPIQVLGADTLKRVGQTELTQALAQTLPSIQVEGFANDQSEFHPQIKLRGLSPNQTLVLVNGKRRHGTANVVVSGGISSGGASPDIQLIPEDAIDHVEVLQDGAAAQYGTDAIAGVVNFILKKNDHGGVVNATVGQYEDGDGATYDVSGSIGVAPIPDMYLDLTAERKHHDYSFRGDYDPRVVNTGYAGSGNTGNNGGAVIPVRYPGVTGFPNYPYVNRIFGDGEYDLTNAMYNFGYTGVHDHDIEFYSFGSYSRRVGRAFENYRLPNVVFGKNAAAARNSGAGPVDTSTYDIPYPSGFAPQEVLRETDYASAGGVKGDIAGTTFDLAVDYGRDDDGIYVEHSANAALYYDTSMLATATTPYKPGFSPTSFYDGSFIATQISETLDLTHKFDLGLAEPVNVAAGYEHRYEVYQLAAGDPASYYVSTNTAAPGGGAQSFFGYSPTNASRNHRSDDSEYLDVSVKPVDKWLVDGAVRHEDYSDFGDTTVFKVTSRYDFSAAFALRGTVATGFRAPTLAEGFYSGLNVSVSSISGIFAPNSAGARALGIGGLGPEKSTNYSVGIVAHPTRRLTATLDLYAIYLRNRIVQSAAFTGYSNNCKFLPGGYTPGQNVQAAYAAFVAGGGACSDVISPAVLTALSGNGVALSGLVDTINQGAAGTIAINSFVNGVSTLTHGADLLLSYASDLGSFGKVDWSLSGNYNYTKVDRVAPPPANVNQSRNLLDLAAITALTDSTPKWRLIGGALWDFGLFDVNLRETFYGPTYEAATFPTHGAIYVELPIRSRFITDLEVGYKATKAIRISAGANNLFNAYPNLLPAAYRTAQLSQSSTGFVTKYPTFSPFGVNGGYYYGRVTLSF